MGYQVTTVTPAKSAPSAQAELPSTMSLPWFRSRRRTARSSFFSTVPAHSKPARAAARLSSRALAFLPKTLPMARSTSASSMESNRASTPT